MSEAQTFGARLKAILEDRGMSQVELGKGLKAKRNGVLEGDLQRAAVNGWITGKGFPNAVQLTAICLRLHVSADQLLFGKISQSNPQVVRAVDALAALTDEERTALVVEAQKLIDSPSTLGSNTGKPLSPRQRLLAGMQQYVGPPLQHEFYPDEPTVVPSKDAP